MNPNDQSRDRNPDPITKAPGSHPIGTGAGALAGGATGAAIGAAGGPIGSAIGTVAGALIGAAGGKAAGEAVNPTADGAMETEQDRLARRNAADRDITETARREDGEIGRERGTPETGRNL